MPWIKQHVFEVVERTAHSAHARLLQFIGEVAVGLEEDVAPRPAEPELLKSLVVIIEIRQVAPCSRKRNCTDEEEHKVGKVPAQKRRKQLHLDFPAHEGVCCVKASNNNRSRVAGQQRRDDVVERRSLVVPLAHQVRSAANVSRSFPEDTEGRARDDEKAKQDATEIDEAAIVREPAVERDALPLEEQVKRKEGSKYFILHAIFVLAQHRVMAERCVRSNDVDVSAPQRQECTLLTEQEHEAAVKSVDR
mmetsp:Transcript_76877/g.213574  ORF Transcript_76877/g.213574 Transcript_76877/m.213574 type:complete len:249 (+) Transcript_76877:114-860(+)